VWNVEAMAIPLKASMWMVRERRERELGQRNALTVKETSQSLPSQLKGARIAPCSCDRDPAVTSRLGIVYGLLCIAATPMLSRSALTRRHDPRDACRPA